MTSHSIRSRARWTDDRVIARRSASSPKRRFGGRPARIGHEPDEIALCWARRPSASSWSIAWSWRPAAATARWRLADSALMTRLRSPRTDRATCRASSSSSAGLRPDPPQERADRLGALPGHHAAATPDAPGRPHLEVRQALDQDGRLVRLDDELEVRPGGGDAQRAAGEEQAAQVGQAAMLGRRRPVERGPPISGLGGACQPEAQPGNGPEARRRPAGQAHGFGVPIARPGRRDRGQLRPEGRDEVAIRRCHRAPGCASARPAGRRGGGRRRSPDQPSRRAHRRRPTPRSPLPFGDPQQRRREPRRLVVVGVVGIDDVVEDEAWGRAAHRRPAQPDRLGPPRRGARAPNWLLASTTSIMPGAVWRSSASTCSARSKPSVSPCCVATLQT